MAMPRVVSRNAFFRIYGTKYGKPGSGAYTRYVRNQRLPVAPVGKMGGYAPGGVAYRQAYTRPAAGGAGGAGGGGGGGGGGLTLMQQATMMVNKALAPVLAATNASYDREQAARQKALHDATEQYINATRPYAGQVAGAYQRAEGAQSGADTALANLLSGQGNQASSELSARLNGPPGSEAAQALQAVGRGAAATSAGMGTADLSRLLSQGAAATTYGARLPGLAGLTGLRDTEAMLAALGRERHDALSKITSAGPEQALSLYQQMLSRRDARQNAEANRALQWKMAQASGLVDITKAKVSAGAQADALNERIRHDKAMENNTAASIDQRAQATADRIAAQKELALINAGTKGAKDEKSRQAAFYRIRQKAFNDAARLFKGPSQAGGAGGMEGGGSTYTRPTRQVAYNRIYQLYAPQLLSYNFNRHVVQQMVNNALRRAGYGAGTTPRNRSNIPG